MTIDFFNLLIATAKTSGLKQITKGKHEHAVKTKSKFNRISIRAVDEYGNSYYYKFTTEGR